MAENKAAAYTIAGVAVVITGAGVVYYLSDPRRSISGQDKKRPSKKERRKAKQEREKEHTRSDAESAPVEAARAVTVESDPVEDIPQIDKSSVERLSVKVGFLQRHLCTFTLTHCVGAR